MVILIIPFLVIYHSIESNNFPLFLGLYILILSFIQFKLGYAVSIIPFAKYFGDYVYYKSENKNMYQVSLVGYAILGTLFILVGIFYN